MHAAKVTSYLVAVVALAALAVDQGNRGNPSVALIAVLVALAIVGLVSIKQPAATSCDYCGRHTDGHPVCYRCRDRFDRAE